jgi:hypothetical protein
MVREFGERGTRYRGSPGKRTQYTLLMASCRGPCPFSRWSIIIHEGALLLGEEEHGKSRTFQ